MTEAKANLKNARIAPRKVRIVGDLIKGKNVARASAELKFLNKKSAKTILKVISSAAANAKNTLSLDKKDLFVKSIDVNKGKVMKRYRAASNRRSLPLKKKMSHIEVVLSDNNSSK